MHGMYSPFDMELSTNWMKTRGMFNFTDVTTITVSGVVLQVIFTDIQSCSFVGLFHRLLPGKANMFGSLNSHPKHSFCFWVLRLCYGLGSRLNFLLANCYPNTMLNKFFPPQCAHQLQRSPLSADQKVKMRVRLDQSGVRLRLSQPL